MAATCTLLAGGFAIAASTAASATTEPLTITTPSRLPDGTVGQSYSYQLEASGGTAPYTWTEQTEGSVFPYNMTLSSSGVVSGTPVVPGSDDFAVFVTDATGEQARAVLELTVNTGTAIDSTLNPVGTELYYQINQQQQNVPGQLSSIVTGAVGLVGSSLGTAETLLITAVCSLTPGVFSPTCLL